LRKEYISPHGRKISFNEGILIMGVLNVTPDSFYDGGRYLRLSDALRRVEKMINEGAHIIDVGGESTRPGSSPVSCEEEADRVIPVIEEIRRNFDVFISIDTYKSSVAEEAISSGADMINDISGLTFDKKMADLVASDNIPVVVSHIKGTPKDMQKNPYYEDPVKEIKQFLEKRVALLKEKGAYQIIIDPGIGFGKRVSDNIEIIKNIREFKKLGYPVLIGHSRKSFIGYLLGNLPPEERLEGTLAITAYLAMKEVNILRVHDVKENVRVIEVIKAFIK